MSSSAMELSILKLTSPRKRFRQSARFTFDNDLAQNFGTGNINPSQGKVIGSPPCADSNRMSMDDEIFTIFEQYRAAIPFKWETIPGTRRDQAVRWVGSQSSKDGMSDSEQEDSSASSPSFSLSLSCSTTSSVGDREEPLDAVQGPAPELQVNSTHLSSLTTPRKDNGSVSYNSELVDEPVCKGQILALRPPPGMHSNKQLLTLESEDRSINPFCFNSRPVNGLVSSSACQSRSIAFLESHQRRSFRKDGLKALPFLSVPKDQIEESSTTVLGFEEWSKVVQQQKKQQKQQQQEAAEIRAPHHRTMSMPRLSFSFRKKPTAEKENGNEFVDGDVIFNEDFGKKGGVRERRPLSSTSSRTLAEGYEEKTRNLVFDDDDTSNNSSQVEAPKEKGKNEVLFRLSRFFKSSRISGDHHEKPHHRPARLSSVSPAPPSPLALTQCELKLKKASHHKQVSKQVSTTTASPLLKRCLSNPVGQALLKNVKQLRSFNFDTPRAIC